MRVICLLHGTPVKLSRRQRECLTLEPDLSLEPGHLISTFLFDLNEFLAKPAALFLSPLREALLARLDGLRLARNTIRAICRSPRFSRLLLPLAAKADRRCVTFVQLGLQVLGMKAQLLVQQIGCLGLLSKGILLSLQTPLMLFVLAAHHLGVAIQTVLLRLNPLIQQSILGA